MTGRHLEPVPNDDDHHNAPPQDLAAERATLGGMLLSRNAITDCLNTVTAPEFYRPAHELIFTAIANLHLAGEPADAITVSDELTRTGDLRRAGGHSYIHDLAAAVPVAASASYYAHIVSEKAAQRRLVEAGTRITQLGYAQAGGNIDDLYQAATRELEQVGGYLPAATDGPAPGETIDELLHGDDEEYDWLIPDFLERGDRMIVTAGEGMGKSSLLRQIAIQAASGMHPWDPTRAIDPIRVLIVDVENSRRQTRRKMRPLRLQAGHHLDPTRLIIECKVDGLDLTTAKDQDLLAHMVRHHQPDLLITGPIYKLANGNPNDEVDAKPIAMFIDRLRAEHGVAVLLEAHSKKGEGGKHRPKEPYGWSGWMRWPEFGIHLGDEGEISHWRGARDERDIPHQLKRGGPWPWMPANSVADQHWITIRDTIRAAGRKLTQRELADATGIRLASVNATCGEHTADLAALYFDLESTP